MTQRTIELTTRGPSRDREPAFEPALPAAYLRACLNLLLGEGPAHGYELADRAAELGLDKVDRGGVYRVLRTLERDGLVTSFHEDGHGGPPRRTYRITAYGRDQLDAGAIAYRESIDAMSQFLKRYRATESRRSVLAA